MNRHAEFLQYWKTLLISNEQCLRIRSTFLEVLSDRQVPWTATAFTGSWNTFTRQVSIAFSGLKAYLDVVITMYCKSVTQNILPRSKISKNILQIQLELHYNTVGKNIKKFQICTVFPKSGSWLWVVDLRFNMGESTSSTVHLLLLYWLQERIPGFLLWQKQNGYAALLLFAVDFWRHLVGNVGTIAKQKITSMFKKQFHEEYKCTM